jgi:selenobiotic family peptide radical SAM maturase
VGKNPVQVAPKWRKVQPHKRPQPRNLREAVAEAETNSAVRTTINWNRVFGWRQIPSGARFFIVIHPIKMQNNTQDKDRLFSRVYPKCSKFVPEDIWQQLVARSESLEFFTDIISDKTIELKLPVYLGELARLELHVYRLIADNTPVPDYADKLFINPTLQLFDNSWKNLARQIDGTAEVPDPEKGEERIVVWRHPVSGMVKAKPVSEDDLLALKIVLEELSVRAVAQEGGTHVAAIESVLIRALSEGLVIGPEPIIKRHYLPENYKEIERSFFEARIFSLQWHITQVCDLHCRHCYDRNQYQTLSLEQETDILDDLADFCSSQNVHGQVTFTGGNPLLHPNFEKLYQEAADRGFTLAILGNPASREQIERVQAIQPLAFYQVSLEGLEEHNDYMRGKGHFKKILAFLDLLRELGIFSMVMLTLTRDNMEQVLPLAEILRDKVDLFTFNRLSLVGEGANLVTVDAGKYPAFLKAYNDAVGTNPCLGIKDNLLNILYHEEERPLFGGCTGFGCGAAFNFITILADGSVHACRKFPSPLGNILDSSLNEIYHTKAADKYRWGAVECEECPIRPVCGGCLAVAHGHGLDIFRQKDPCCFIDSNDIVC